MINSQDAILLANLYTSQPENEEQVKRKDKLIYELELKLGIIKLDDSAMVINGDLDDVETLFKR
ncbi:MAG: hypothetical protein JHC33_14620 [Ignisphaera sp.]|nr:hypothetical protein [Ignisphaera sp.]